jgi:cell division transport system permease protein
MANSVNRATKGRLRSSYISSIISLSLVLFTLGSCILWKRQKLSSYVKENIGFDIYLVEGVSDAEAHDLKKQLDSIVYIKSTQYFSNRNAAKSWPKSLVRILLTISYNPIECLH